MICYVYVMFSWCNHRQKLERRSIMVNVGLFVRLVPKPGKEAEVEAFLNSGLALVEEERTQPFGSRCAWTTQPSASLTHFRMNQDGERISPAELRPL
jgi:hypothetical protein